MFARFSRIGISLALLATLSGCAWTGRQSTFDAKGPIAQVQLDLFMVTVWVSLFLFVTVGGAMVYAVWKFRERPGEPVPKRVETGHGNPLIEIGLISGSILCLVIIAVPTVRAIWYTHQMPEHPGSHLAAWYGGDDVAEGEEDNVLVVKATGYQWWWSFEYPQLGGLTTANEFVIPAGKVVRIELRSADVIHSFWLPKLAGKVDLIPGRANWKWIQAGETFEDWKAQAAEEAPDIVAGKSEASLRSAYEAYLQEDIFGHYYGQCAEYCGDSHAYMLFRADVVSDERFAEWVREQKETPPPPKGADWGAFMNKALSDESYVEGDPIAHGAYLYMTQGTCIQCHKVEGTPSNGMLGPDLTHVASRSSLAAGWMEHRNEDGTIDREKQYANLVEWIYASETIKPGNLMYYPENGLKNVIHPEPDSGREPLTREDVEKISAWLMTLR